MIGLDRVSGRILSGIWNPFRIVKRIGRSRSDARSHDKGFDAESADELAVTDTIFVSLDIALVPGQAKRRIRHLDDEQVKVGVRRQSPHFYLHDFNGADRFYFYPAMRVRRNLGKICQPLRPDEVEFEVIAIIVVVSGQHRSRKQRRSCHRSKCGRSYMNESAKNRDSSFHLSLLRDYFFV